MCRLPLFLSLPLLVIPSCGLLRAPVRIVGGTVTGVAEVTKYAATAPKKAMDKRRARKQAAEKEKKNASQKQGPATPGQNAGPLTPPPPDDSLPLAPEYSDPFPEDWPPPEIPPE